MPRIIDQHYLREEQYKTPANLQARIILHQRFSTNPYPWQRWVFDQFDLRPGMRLLEVGCGPGGLWSENLDRLPPEVRITLGDLSTGMAAAARAAVDGHASFSFIGVDAQDIPLASASLERVVANHMLYHVPDMAKAVREIARVLKPGGILYAATNGLGHLRELGDLIRLFRPDYAGMGDSIRAFRPDCAGIGQQVRRFSLETAPEVLQAAFGEIEVRRYNSDLEITEAEPLINYVHSMWEVFEPGDQERWLRLEEHIRQIFQKQGRFHIAKSAGLVIARG